MSKDQIINVRVDSSLDLRLKDERQRTGCSIAEFMRRAAVHELNRLAAARRDAGGKLEQYYRPDPLVKP